MVNEDRDTTIRTILRKPRFFLNVLADVDALVHVVRFAVRFLQFLENDGSLVTYYLQSV